MKKVLIALLALTFLLTSISAICESGQININTADAAELDKLAGIGPAYAKNIIDSRPFDSLDDLINVKGIGEITLNKIKEQNLACVDGEEESSQEENVQDEEIQKEDVIINEDNINVNKKEINVDEDNKSNITITGENIKTIVLNPKDIKSETDNKQLNKNKLPIYGLIVFCILLVFLFIFKKRKEKNEFK